MGVALLAVRGLLPFLLALAGRLIQQVLANLGGIARMLMGQGPNLGGKLVAPGIGLAAVGLAALCYHMAGFIHRGAKQA